MRDISILTDVTESSLQHVAFETILRGFLPAESATYMQTLQTTASIMHASFLLEHLLSMQARWGDPEETILVFLPSPLFAGQLQPQDTASLAVARTVQGTMLCGTHLPLVLSRVHSQIERVWSYEEVSSHSNETARCARLASHLATYTEERLDMQELHPSVVPAVDRSSVFVGHREGNRLYLTTRWSELHAVHGGARMVHMQLGDVQVQAHIGGTPGTLSAQSYLVQSDWGPIDDPYVMLVGEGDVCARILPGASVMYR